MAKEWVELGSTEKQQTLRPPEFTSGALITRLRCHPERRKWKVTECITPYPCKVNAYIFYWHALYFNHRGLYYRNSPHYIVLHSVFPPDRAIAGIPRCPALHSEKAPRKMKKGPIWPFTFTNATNISFLATKNSGLVATIATSFLYVGINNGYLRRPYVLLENHIERSSLLKHST